MKQKIKNFAETVSSLLITGVGVYTIYTGIGFFLNPSVAYAGTFGILAVIFGFMGTINIFKREKVFAIIEIIATIILLLCKFTCTLL